MLPMLWEDSGLGSIAVVRWPPRPFSDREQALLQTFADQAAIAIQNARLFNETQEALEQQKASADVLGAISRSVADTAPVFETILDACQRLFGGEELDIFTVGEDDMVRVAASRGPSAEELRHDVTPLAESVTGRVIRERRIHHIPDLRAVPNLSKTAPRAGGTIRRRVARLCADAVGGPRRRLHPRVPLAAEAVHRQGAGVAAELRRSGGDRDPERAAVPGDPGGAQTADRDERDSPGHRLIPRRRAARSGEAGGDGLPSVRRL